MTKIWLKREKKCNKCLNNIRIKNEKPSTEHVYQKNTKIKTERTLIIG